MGKLEQKTSKLRYVNMNKMKVSSQVDSYKEGHRTYHHNGYHNLHTSWFPHVLPDSFETVTISKYSRTAASFRILPTFVIHDQTTG